jgi:hypothetical protein
LRRIWRGDEPLPVDKVKKALNSALESGEKAVDEVKKKVAPDPKKKN